MLVSRERQCGESMAQQSEVKLCQTQLKDAQSSCDERLWSPWAVHGSPWQSWFGGCRTSQANPAWLHVSSSGPCWEMLKYVENCWNFTKRCENSNVHAFAYCAHIWYSHKSCMDTQLSSEVWQAWSLGLDGSWFSAEFSTAFLSFDFIHWKCALTSKHQPTTVDFDLSESIISIGVYRSLLHFYSNIITRPVYPNWTSPQL